MDDERLAIINALITNVQKEVAYLRDELNNQTQNLRNEFSEQAKKLDKFLELLTVQAGLSARMASIEKKSDAECARNEKDHDELFTRLRINETAISSVPATASKQEKVMGVIWDVVKLLLAVFIGYLVGGKIKL
jgi:hypothetical protein